MDVLLSYYRVQCIYYYRVIWIYYYRVQCRTRPELNFAPVPGPPVQSGLSPGPVPGSVTGTYHENMLIKLTID